MKALPKEHDIYLIDHAWVFSVQDAAATLLNNEALTARLEKLTEFTDKLDIPQVEEKKETKDAQAAF